MNDPAAASLPIFPLNTVLFPDGVLPLRVFEARYVDMVSDCLRRGTEFGVCLIASGKEVGAAAEPAAIGCRARIVDFNMEQLGVLQISTVGTTRFRILATTVTPAGLVRATIEDLEEETVCGVPAQWQGAAQLLERIVEQIEADPDKVAGAGIGPIAKPYRYADAGWVGNRLCEMLPLPLPARQELMSLTNALLRLEQVHKILADHKAL